mmetsp:Transcript_3161/g.6685  ORF Transcript_3161/g.6685 Transcript_3161/m.6685 type:complete len:355 (+) Transcript_3161:32-1096(+)
MARPSSTLSAILAWFLLTFTIYRIFISTEGLSNKRIPNDQYEVEFLPHFKSNNDHKSAYNIQPYTSLQRQIRRQPPVLNNLRDLNESTLPAKCGIFFFYHIACTGGASINWWLGKEKDRNINTTTYWTDWGRHEGVEPRFIVGMDRQIDELQETLEKNNNKTGHWKIAHAHGFSFFTNSSEPHLLKWRDRIESMGCRFVVATMLRDAVGHTISQYKTNVKLNLTLDEWISHLHPDEYNEKGIFNTQIDYLLYNRGPRNRFRANNEEKIRRAMELLQRHFDIVLLSDYERFTKIVLKLTGWKGVDMRHHNSFNGPLNFTERELDMVRRFTEFNGDVGLIDAVRHVYYGHMDYLLE